MRELNGFNLMGLFRQQYYMTDELLDDALGGGHNVTRPVTCAVFTRLSSGLLGGGSSRDRR